MKQTLIPGKPVEIPTLEEITKVIAARDAQKDERLLRTSENVKTDGAGSALLDQLYAVPVGFELVLYRWSIPNVDGSTPGNPFTGANGFVALLADEQIVDWFQLAPGAGNGIPNRMSWGQNQGPVIGNGQRVGIQVVLGPLNTNIETRIQGILRRSEPRRRL